MKAKKNQNGEVEILIAEDSPTQREQLEYLLKDNGYEVVAATNGKEALAAARQRQPALIISDVLMPELDGYGLSKAIKSDETLKSIPVILVTTLSDPQDVILGLECGADNFIRKPYEERYLLSRIEYLLMNLELRKNQRMQVGVEINLGGEKHFITAERQQILDLLISTYEQAVHINEELKAREKELAHSNLLIAEHKQAFELSPDPTWIIDGNRFVECNDAAVSTLGYTSREEFLNVHPSKLSPPMQPGGEDSYVKAERMMALAREQGLHRFEWIHTKADGMNFVAEVTLSAIEINHRHVLYCVWRDITKRKQVEAEILRFKNVLDNTLDMIFMFEPESLHFVYLNQGAVLSMGYSREELLGMAPYQIKPLIPEPKFRQLIAPLLSGEQPSLSFDTLHRRKDGTDLSVAVFLQLVTQSDGSRLFVAIVRDITERKRAQDQILRLNASLEERVRQRTEELEEKNQRLADQKVEVEYKNREIEAAKLMLEEKAEQLALTSKYKSEFLSSMSHELRTPLTSLLILAQLLAENAEHNLSGQQIEYAKIIQGAGKDLLKLINDILDLSKIESGTVTLELQDESFANVRAQVERVFHHMAESRGLGFGVELAPGLPPSLYTDSQRLQQVLKNLLSNAFKFTDKGQVSLRIAPVESGWSVDHDGLNRAQTVIGFFVTDSGIGLSEDKQKIIFEAFQQADAGTARKYGGTGLGLSISREIAWLVGGELRLVESAPGQGSTFVLYLPLRAPEHSRRTTSLPPVVADGRAAIKPGEPLLIIEDDADLAGILSADSLAGKKVLVVDDDVRNIFALTAVLERHKMAVRSAENGRAALEELGQNPDVDIVLMDIMMPEMDGFETLRQIRQMKQFASLPMIALTAKAMTGDREQCIEAGASDYVSKPVDTDQLLSLLRVWLYR